MELVRRANHEKRSGLYVRVACDLPLFPSRFKPGAGIRRMVVDAKGQLGYMGSQNGRLGRVCQARKVLPGAAMTKLSEYVEIAAMEYLLETGKDELDAHWIAEFFQDSGVQDDYPRQDLVAFGAMVQKELTKKSERAAKQTRFQLDKIVRRKP